ncbi:putative secreted protein [Crenobacter luteus]|uniref:SIMPL domain-containing protein n=1 Tax=Crenobacter luteus TaxID=1452487 RepID=A0A163CDU4_9NEIS|nr:SIMPL domain-containing protein [Crenobacter luteus]KZE31631.1 hypothetical protein AVW16_00130 [Crenobacter luteus]TCP15490.1 putative secreted protein [Crenobacter luteus]
MRALNPLLLTFALGTALPAYAASEATQLSLSGSAEREVDNDQISVTLYVQDQHGDPARLADRLNRTLKQGLAEAGKLKDADVSGGQVRTWPQYDRNGRISGWQGRGEMRIRGPQTAELSALIGRLQGFMQLENVQFGVSDKARRATEAALIPEAIRAFKARAAEVGRAIDKPAIRVKELTLGEQGRVSPYPVAMYKSAAAPEADAVSAPTWQAGKSTISVEVSGKVELN